MSATGFQAQHRLCALGYFGIGLSADPHIDTSGTTSVPSHAISYIWPTVITFNINTDDSSYFSNTTKPE